MDYYQSNKISNSSLSYINPIQGGSPRKFKDYIDGNLKQDSTPSLYAGTTIHQYFLEPETFMVSDVDRPSDTIVRIIDKVYQITRGELDTDINSHHEFIFGSAKEFGYGQSWKPETLIKKIIDQGKDYYDFLHRADGKICIDQKMAGMLSNIKESVNNHALVKDLLFETPGVNEEDVYWGPDEAYKSKIDRYTSNALIDLKTTSKALSFFRDSFNYYHYDRQLAFYKDALEWIGKPVQKCFIIAIETTGYNQVRVFEIGEKLIDEGRQKYLGLLERIKYHQETQQWVEPRDVYENKGLTIFNSIDD
jgi:hypothetical protein